MASFTVDSGAVFYDGRVLYPRTTAYTVKDTFANYQKSLVDVAAGKITVTVAFVNTSAASTPDGLQFRGICNTGMTASTTDIYIDEFIGFGNDYFNGCYYLQVLKNANSVGNAPQTQIRKITDYVSATGKFICDAFGANVEASDEVLVMHESLVGIGRNDNNNILDSSSIVANADGSMLERLEYIQNTVKQYGKGFLASKLITYNGGTSYNAFTVTGLVAVKVIGYITTPLSNVAATTSVGTATSAAGCIAATAGTAMQTANQIWNSNAPAKFYSSMGTDYNLIGDGEDIVVDGDATLAAGVVVLYCFWIPLNDTGNLVAVS